MPESPLAVRARVLACRACELRTDANRPVPWEGDGGPDRIAVVGEAPGRYEDRTGKPFVGPAGELLRTEIRRAGADPGRWAYLNAVSCWPNDAPLQTFAIESCRRHLDDQLVAIDPAWIVVLGTTALASWVVGLTINDVAGKPFKIRLRERMIWCYPTVHPAMALQDPRHRKRLSGDLDVFVRGGLMRLTPAFDARSPSCVTCMGNAKVWDETNLGWCEKDWKQRQKVVKRVADSERVRLEVRNGQFAF